jgi:hypothetical protein
MKLPFGDIQQMAKKVFAVQKKILRFKTGVKKSLLYGINIPPLANEYLFSSLSFVVDNMEIFKIQECVHKHDLHVPNANLTRYQKGVYYTGTKS